VARYAFAMFDKLDEVRARFDALTERLAAPDLQPQEIVEVGKERNRLEPIVEKYTALTAKSGELDDNKSLLGEDDDELKAMAKEEIARLEGEIEALTGELKILLLPRDPNDDKNIILEIRAGTGGDEAALFAGDLFKMYMGYAQGRRWKADVISQSEGAKGGFKEVIAQIEGDQVYSHLKYEAGVHRVQRVPETESQGRIHTSACTVAVLPEAEEVELKIDPKELRIDTMRAGGPGGQSVNTTDSAVRITHLPTGLIVQCQDEKSQLKNKNKAMTVLRARLLERMEAEAAAERAGERKAMVKSGDRSEKIRTYNFPQDRCTDHRASITVHNLPKLFTGEMDPLLDQVRTQLQAEQLKELEEGG
jgi:peptide chain release factor 1